MLDSNHSVRSLLLIGVGALMLAVFALSVQADTRVIVRFESGSVEFPALDRGFGSDFVASAGDARIADPSLGATLANLGATSFRVVAPFFRHLTVPQYDHQGNRVELIDMKDDYVVTFSGAYDVDDLIERLNSTPGVNIAERIPEGRYFFEPDDEYFDLQWYLYNSGQDLGDIYSGCSSDTVEHCIPGYDIGAKDAWGDVLAPGTKIGLIDTGVRETHEDLYTSVDHGLSETGDPCGHGTALSGVVAAAGDNSNGIAGTARPDYTESSAILVVLKNQNGNCTPSPSMAENAISHFANDPDYYPDVLVANESWGGPVRKWEYTTTARDVRRNAYLKGITLTAAAGNLPPWCSKVEQDSCVIYPAAFNYFTIAATGLDCRGGNPWPAFNWTDVAAPSQKIVTTNNDISGTKYDGVDTPAHCGTSFSGPLTAASAAMLLGANSQLTPDDIGAVLRLTARDLGTPGWDKVYGHGLIQLDDAVDFVTSPNTVRFGTSYTFDATYLESREQEFMNVPGANSSLNTWEDFWVHVYQVDVWAPFRQQVGDTVIAAWARERLSTGFPNEDKIDARFLTSHIGVVPVSLTESGCTLRTYTYKIFTDSSEDSCLVWYPLTVQGQGTCGPSISPNLPRFDYTYVFTPESGAAGPPPTESLTLHIQQSGTGVLLKAEASGASDVIFEIHDVAGRLVWTSEARGAEGSFARAFWKTGRGQASGIYFASARSGEVRTSRKLLVVN